MIHFIKFLFKQLLYLNLKNNLLYKLSGKSFQKCHLQSWKLMTWVFRKGGHRFIAVKR